MTSHRRAMARACDETLLPPEPLGPAKGESKEAWMSRLIADQRKGLAAWRSQHRWHPHQLRHNAATEFRREFGPEVARIVLGHRSAAITEIYAESDVIKAREVMLKVG